MPARHYVTTVLLGSVIAAIAWLLDSQPSRSQVSPEALTGALSDADQAALRTARHVADRLLALNAGALKSAVNDPDLKQSIDELQRYLKTVGTTYVRARQGGLDPQSAMVIAGVAGELTPYKADYDALLKAARDRSWAEARGFAAQKLGEKMGEELGKATLKGTTGATLGRIPAGVMDTSKVGARFIMAYEAGVIDSALPQGLRPVLEKNPTTRAWLNEVTAALQQPVTTSRLPTSTWTPSAASSAPGRPNGPPSPNSGRVANISPAAPGISNNQAPPTQSLSATSRGTYASPGGISLSRAAADRMPLEIALDASALSDGKIVLSGRTSNTRMDAALFLTALRAACDDHDPYFSLDPDNGALWSQQGDQASNEFWERIKKDFASDSQARTKTPGVAIRTVSATQHYTGIWQDISPHYPNFRSKLVFYPEWLRQTRLGEVLYKADVLLKELSSGVSILVPGKFRAAAVAGYLSADTEYAAKTLLVGERDENAVRPQWRGSRLWFDIAPSELPATTINETTGPSLSGDPALRSLLRSQGLIRSADKSVQNSSFAVRHGSVFDLSEVNPIMFVRVHDHATNEDLSDHDPRLDRLAADVSTRFDQYAEHYDELRLLREIARAYIAARKIIAANERLCGNLDAMPLLDSEKLATKLPEYHPSELFVTIASYSTASRKGGHTQSVRTSSMSGGVSIAGQKFDEMATRDGETMITRALEQAIAGDLRVSSTIADPDRRFISFSIEDASGALVRLASNAPDLSSPRSLSDYPIENEPGAAVSPFAGQNGQRGSGSEWSKSIGVFLVLLAVGLLVNHVARKRRIARS